jgi:hypothetical protein
LPNFIFGTWISEAALGGAAGCCVCAISEAPPIPVAIAAVECRKLRLVSDISVLTFPYR